MSTDTAAPVDIYAAQRVITMTGEDAQALAVQDGKVLSTGTSDALRSAFPDAAVHDLAGRTIIPGLNDGHMHLVQAAEEVLHLDLSYPEVSSIATVTDKVAAQAQQLPEGAWVRGSRYDDGKMAENRALTRDDLDRAAPDHPVLVIHVAGHWGVANSAALRLGGVEDDTPDPEGGGFGRDGGGRLNGVLYEQALFDFAYPQVARRPETVLPPATFEDRLAGLQRAMQMFHAAGLTSVGDALVGPADMELLREARNRGLLTTRVNALIAAEHYDRLPEFRAWEGVGDEWLRIGGVKSFVDGAIGGRTCMMEEPFTGTDDYGIQSRSTEWLRDLVRKAQRDGTRLGIHANGDRAIDIILGLFEQAAADQPRPGLRHRIEHCTVVTEDLVTRIKRLGAMAVPFGSYVNYHGERLLEWYGPDRVTRMFAHRWFLDAGVVVAGSSDFLCGPYEPLLGLQSCVTRQGADGSDVGANQRISLEEALRCYTVNAARLSDEQDIKGRLAPGYLADFVVLDEDPFAVDPAHLGSIPIRSTHVGGQAVWTSDAA